MLQIFSMRFERGLFHQSFLVVSQVEENSCHMPSFQSRFRDRAMQSDLHCECFNPSSIDRKLQCSSASLSRLGLFHLVPLAHGCVSCDLLFWPPVLEDDVLV